MEIIWINLLRMVGILILLFGIPVLIGFLLPRKYIMKYMAKTDHVIDWGVGMGLVALLGICVYIIVLSHSNNGPVFIDATYFNEAEVEIVLGSIVLLIVEIHTAVQFRVMWEWKKMKKKCFIDNTP